jgi:hypothetical protein
LANIPSFLSCSSYFDVFFFILSFVNPDINSIIRQKNVFSIRLWKNLVWIQLNFMKIFLIFRGRLEQSSNTSNDKRRPMCGSTRSGEGRRGKKRQRRRRRIYTTNITNIILIHSIDIVLARTHTFFFCFIFISSLQ